LFGFWWEGFVGEDAREEVHRGLSAVCEDSTHDAAFGATPLVDERRKIVGEERFTQHFISVFR
jgi:hypothetical protein